MKETTPAGANPKSGRSDIRDLYIFKSRPRPNDVRFTPKADMCSANTDVCFVPIADIGRLSRER